MNDPILSLIGLCLRAGRLKSGTGAFESIKTNEANLIIIADDASENTLKKATDSCAYYGVDYRIYGTKESLGHAVGKEIRAVLAVTDPGFSDSIIKKLDALNRTS